MSVKQYLLQVIEGEKNRTRDTVVKAGLWILAQIYRAAVFLRRKAYEWNLKTKTELEAQVISVGNITIGGTGKTPVVKKLARKLKAADYQVAVLSRGYKGDFTGEIGVVSNGEKLLMTPEEAGDEAYMLAKNLADVPVLVGPKRSETGRYACRFFDPDFIILDDGFQHWQVKRDYELVTVDATNPFDNRHLLPRGKLREPVANLQRGHLLLVTKADQVVSKEITNIKEEVMKINPKAEVITTSHAPTYLRPIGSQECRPPNLDGERVLAVSGIGVPDAFEQTLQDLGAEVVKGIRFQDHHVYEDEEIMEIFTIASEKDVDRIVTTEKDAVNMNGEIETKINRQQIAVEVLGIEVKVTGREEEFAEILSQLEVVTE